MVSAWMMILSKFCVEFAAKKQANICITEAKSALVVGHFFAELFSTTTTKPLLVASSRTVSSIPKHAKVANIVGSKNA